MGREIELIHQEKKAEEKSARDNKTKMRNQQNIIITVNSNGSFCAQEKKREKIK